MKKLLFTTAVFEAVTGILLISSPQLVASLLLGSEALGEVALTIARIAGAALMSLAIACLLFRQNEYAGHVVKAMLFYNIAVAAILIYSKLSFELAGIGLMPAIGVHFILAVWNIIEIAHSSRINGKNKF